MNIQKQTGQYNYWLDGIGCFLYWDYKEYRKNDKGKNSLRIAKGSFRRRNKSNDEIVVFSVNDLT